MAATVDISSRAARASSADLWRRRRLTRSRNRSVRPRHASRAERERRRAVFRSSSTSVHDASCLMGVSTRIGTKPAPPLESPRGRPLWRGYRLRGPYRCVSESVRMAPATAQELPHANDWMRYRRLGWCGKGGSAPATRTPDSSEVYPRANTGHSDE